MVNLNGMTLKELSQKMGVSIQYLSEVFKGEKTLSEERLKQITKILPELKNKFVVKTRYKVTYLYKEVGD